MKSNFLRHMHKYLAAMLFLVFFISGYAQQPQKLDAAEIQLGLKKLNKLGSVLYIAAHPDDENTRLIAYLSNEALLNTAYLSITRGDGGQNLVGPEIREMLGVIRTQELLMARKLDGGQQFFTRANDFGYSKDAQETFAIWDKEKVLGDVVWVIRKFRPDVIITRFPPDERARHGQHTASAILAEEAFDAAADPQRFPEQLKHVDPWQARSLLFNTHWWFSESKEAFDPSDMLTLDVGAYNHLLGQSYTEIAAESRSMHKSQGFGSTGTRGSELEYLSHVKGEKIGADFFEGKELSWDRLKNGKAIGDLLEKAYREYDAEMPEKIVPVLLQAYQHMLKLENGYYQELKLTEVKKIIQAALGLYLEAAVEDTYGTPGETIKVKLEATNRSQLPVTLGSFEVPGAENREQGIVLAPNEKFAKELDLVIPLDQHYSQPYWLRTQGSVGMFAVDDPLLIGKPENDPALTIPFNLTIAGQKLVYEVPVVHKRNDAVKGEIFQPFAIAPPVSMNFEEKVQVFADAAARDVSIMVKSGKDSIRGELRLEIPDGWKVTPEMIPFTLGQKGSEKMVTFTLYPPELPGEGKIKAIATIGKEVYSMEKVTISYDHIPDQMLLPEAAGKVVKLDIVTRGQLIGYVMGAGDEIPGSLRQIGYQVEILAPELISTRSLEDFDAIILGIRALNTVERLQYDMPKLLDYVKTGGTLIVQYNTNFRMVTDQYAPYPLEISRDRVAVEDAEVRFLIPEHPVLNLPNKITEADFDFWVQERGLYFPDKWDPRYEAVLSTNDPGESPKNGGLLITRYGDGYYVYTGLSWFRELPAGVPGAYRLFANIISLGHLEPGN